jgi:flagellum-specific peptidoglycan hydrolase FlgJ
MRLKYLIHTSMFFVLSLALLSCGSKRKVSDWSEEDAATKRERYLIAESDAIFERFQKDNHGKVNDYTLDYIKKYKNIAIMKMEEYKIPASITLAQGILESGNGLSELTRKANNHFGIKCHKGWQGKKVYHDDDKRNECFRKYPTPEGSFTDHSLFLTTRNRYDFLFDLKQDDYKGWAKGLKKAGYATDRKYPRKLISFIENFELYRYDDLVLDKKGYDKAPSRPVASVDRTLPSKASYNIYVVDKGDTLYSIAKRHDLTVEQLKRINKLDSNTISIGQELLVSE